MLLFHPSIYCLLLDEGRVVLPAFSKVQTVFPIVEESIVFKLIISSVQQFIRFSIFSLFARHWLEDGLALGPLCP